MQASNEQPLWVPSQERIERANLTAFTRAVEKHWGIWMPDYPALHRFSIEQPEKFWVSVWDFCGIVAELRGDRVIASPGGMFGTRFFPDAKLNFAENLLRRRDDGLAVVFWGEERVKRRLTHRELYDAVSRLAQALHAAGVQPGDRVAALMANVPEAVIAMLATASLGAIWSSCSPDLGVQGVLDRFGQIEPKLLLSVDAYYYNGKVFDCLARVQQIVERLPSLARAVIVPYVNERPRIEAIPRAVTYAELIADFTPTTIPFVRLPFNHPFYILYSSGTTGVPKCIVHGAGGTLIQHLKEHVLHTDIKRDDRLFYFSTCSWMMWNWLVSSLASGAALMLYDGSPLHPTPDILFDYADAEKISVFGTSAKYIDSIKKMDLSPRDTHQLESVRTLLSTGSPLAPESFDYVYTHIKRDICLSSISGGTDIVSCFALGCPVLPVWRGELQCLGLGMKVEVFDDAGEPVEGGKGELVCTAAFPSMPVGFWHDAGDAKYRAAYFERFPGIWCHGDYVERSRHGGLIVHGRSDAVLNPGGVRIGTAEIYRQVEQLPEVQESIVIGQDWDNDVRIVLFVRLQEGLRLNDALIQKIKQHIRTNATPRHVPAKIVQVPDIPRTRNGKLVELAVRNVVHGRPVKNVEALANPQALEYFRDIPELRIS